MILNEEKWTFVPKLLTIVKSRALILMSKRQYLMLKSTATHIYSDYLLVNEFKNNRFRDYCRTNLTYFSIISFLYLFNLKFILLLE
jgi:hypothetical protein